MSETQSGIPRGLEVLLMKASVDPPFKDLLLARRGEAAATIGLNLEPAEVLLLQSASAEQLEAIIARTTVPQEHRRAFLGHAAATMLAALGVGSLTSTCEAVEKLMPAPGGIAPAPPLPPSPSPEKIELHVREVIANRFHIQLDDVKPKVLLLDLLHAGVARPTDLPLPVAGVRVAGMVAGTRRLPDDVVLLGLKRQLEKEYAINLNGDGLRDPVRSQRDQQRAKALIQDLADNSYEVREKATEELIRLGTVALPLLREAARSQDPEVARRASDCLSRIEDFFAKVKTVGELVQAVQAAVKNRSQPGKEEPTPRGGVQPITHGTRPKG